MPSAHPRLGARCQRFRETLSGVCGQCGGGAHARGYAQGLASPGRGAGGDGSGNCHGTEPHLAQGAGLSLSGGLAREDASIRSPSGGRDQRRRRTAHPFAQGAECRRAGSAPVLPFAGARAKRGGHRRASDPAFRAGAGQTLRRPREAARRETPGQDHRAHRTAQAKVPGIGQHYRIEYQTEGSGKKLNALTWTKQPLPGTQMSDPGVYCLRSNETSWTPEQLWRTYVTLTDIEVVFRSLKSELGLRPIFHRKQTRSDAHLFISVLAYQFVQIIRKQLAERGIHDSWASLRKLLQVQRRVTSSFKTRGGRTLNVRKASLPEPDLAPLYSALALAPNPGGTKKLIT